MAFAVFGMKIKKKVFVLMLLSFGANAEIYKCVVDGKAHYAERPCAPNAKTIDTSGANINRERQSQAEEVARREQRLSDSNDLEKRIDALERQRAQATAQPSAKEKKQARCEQLLLTAKNAKNEAAMYRYHGGLIDDARRRQKEAEDAHFSECYSTQ